MRLPSRLPEREEILGLSTAGLLKLLARYGVEPDTKALREASERVFARVGSTIREGVEEIDPATWEAIEGAAERAFDDTLRRQVKDAMRAYRLAELEELRGEGTEFIWIATMVNTCPSCEARHGQIDDLRDGWERRGLPGSSVLICDGNCNCQLLPVPSGTTEGEENPWLRLQVLGFDMGEQPEVVQEMLRFEGPGLPTAGMASVPETREEIVERTVTYMNALGGPVNVTLPVNWNGNPFFRAAHSWDGAIQVRYDVAEEIRSGLEKAKVGAPVEADEVWGTTDLLHETIHGTGPWKAAGPPDDSNPAFHYYVNTPYGRTYEEGTTELLSCTNTREYLTSLGYVLPESDADLAMMHGRARGPTPEGGEGLIGRHTYPGEVTAMETVCQIASGNFGMLPGQWNSACEEVLREIAIGTDPEMRTRVLAEKMVEHYSAVPTNAVATRRQVQDLVEFYLDRALPRIASQVGSQRQGFLDSAQATSAANQIQAGLMSILNASTEAEIENIVRLLRAQGMGYVMIGNRPPNPFD